MAKTASFLSIGELFYRTRVLRGREWTLRRFAAELGIDHVLLSFIEKGQRFPSEPLVRKLASLRGEDPCEVLAILHRDRIVRALSREIRRAIDSRGDANSLPSFDSTDQNVSVSGLMGRALSALPDSGEPVAASGWRRAVRAALRAEGAKGLKAEVDTAVALLERKGLVRCDGDSVRKTMAHVHAAEAHERVDLAIELARVFAKSLTDEVVRDAGPTYLQNHFLNLPAARRDEFFRELDASIRAVVTRFASEEPGTEFLQILVAATSKEGERP